MIKSILLTLILVIYFCDVLVQAETLHTFVEEQTAGTTFDGKDQIGEAESNEEYEFEDIDVELEAAFTKDPLQPYNRAIFTFNDKLYFHGIKPLCKGYNKVVPEKARSGVRNFFKNIKMPVRFFNCLFQGKFKGAGTEILRFAINSTVGVAGFSDPAKSRFNLEEQDEDFGQTLAHYKVGQGIFIEWPFLGPSSLRDTFGFIGDLALNPLTIVSFAVTPSVTTGAGVYNEFNEVSLGKGEAYENITGPAVDPYIAVQDAYIQHRNKQIKE